MFSSRGETRHPWLAWAMHVIRIGSGIVWSEPMKFSEWSCFEDFAQSGTLLLVLEAFEASFCHVGVQFLDSWIYVAELCLRLQLPYGLKVHYEASFGCEEFLVLWIEILIPEKAHAESEILVCVHGLIGVIYITVLLVGNMYPWIMVRYFLLVLMLVTRLVLECLTFNNFDRKMMASRVLHSSNSSI